MGRVAVRMAEAVGACSWTSVGLEPMGRTGLERRRVTGSSNVGYSHANAGAYPQSCGTQVAPQPKPTSSHYEPVTHEKMIKHAAFDVHADSNRVAIASHDGESNFAQPSERPGSFHPPNPHTNHGGALGGLPTTFPESCNRDTPQGDQPHRAVLPSNVPKNFYEMRDDTGGLSLLSEAGSTPISPPDAMACPSAQVSSPRRLQFKL